MWKIILKKVIFPRKNTYYPVKNNNNILSKRFLKDESKNSLLKLNSDKNIKNKINNIDNNEENPNNIEDNNDQIKISDNVYGEEIIQISEDLNNM